jgi:hypothetical protein
MPAKPVTVPEKLLKLAAEITDTGSANLTRLTVLKKWFDGPSGPDRIRAFGAWIARRAIGSGLKSAEDGAAPLLHEARTMLRGRDRFRPRLSAAEQEKFWAFYIRLRDFQNTYRRVYSNQMRQITNWDLFLVEEGIRLLMRSAHPAEAYDLAAAYCRHYDPHTFHALNGPSVAKILAIVRFMRGIEQFESAGHCTTIRGRR